MALDLDDCTFFGPALPEPFVKFELEDLLRKKGLLPKASGAEGKTLAVSWDSYRRSLRALGDTGGPVRVFNHVLSPLVERLGYATSDRSDPVRTREGDEDGGWVFATADGGARLRVWSIECGADMDAPNLRGRAYRFSPTQVACRVLLQQRERVGLLTDGRDLRLLVSDPAGRDSHVEIHLDRSGGWRGAKDPPDSYRLILALSSPKGVAAVPDLVEAARLTQVRVTGTLREQARGAVEGFLQHVLDHPDNAAAVAAWPDRQALARILWHEGLVLVYRLLFVLKLESSPDPSRAFAFASSSLWRNTFSPNVALSRYARLLLHEGRDTGHLLEHGLRGLFRLFCEGLDARELPVKPLGGMLFGREAVPVIDGLAWGERAVAILLDRLLWTPVVGRQERRRVYYGSLDVEDLGRVYESLLELEPGFSDQPMCRLRRAKLEVVVPVAQGERYRATAPADGEPDAEAPADDPEDEAGDDEGGAGKTKVEWIEEIPPGRFFLRVGLGRKASGSYYTPHSFVKFLVRETLDPLVAERSPVDDPQPGAILRLKVLDPAMGSGHFLVEAARFLGDKLYEACRLADEAALELERQAETAKDSERDRILGRARDMRRRIEDLPDPEDEILAYLPSRAPEGIESGLSQSKALALCRRLVTVHCLYGVDKNPLAVELAKLSLWIEAHAEGLPLTFLDHRLVVGDSLTGPFFEHLLTLPGSRGPLDDLFRQGLANRLTAAFGRALAGVAELEKSIGVSLADVEAKRRAKADLDRVLAPFRVVAAAWAGGVMLGPEQCDDPGYAWLVEAVAGTGTLPASLTDRPRLRAMVARGLGVDEVPLLRDDLLALVLDGRTSPAFAYDLAFPEVFHPDGTGGLRAGFDVVLGNPPWEAIQFKSKEFFAALDFDILNAPTKRERAVIEDRLLLDPAVAALFESYKESFEQQKRANDALYQFQKVQVEGDLAGRQVDAFRVFMERNAQLLGPAGRTGVLVPSAFHANEGATGVRRLYLQELALQTCYSFENRRKLFEIDSRFKFALVVAARPGPTTEFRCAFYLHDDEWLFGRGEKQDLRYDLDFVSRTGGEYLALLELRSPEDFAVARTCFEAGEPFGSVCERLRIRFGRECDMTNDAWRFTPTAKVLPNGEDPRDPHVLRNLIARGYLVLHEGKTFHQFNDRWDNRPRYVLSLSHIDHRGMSMSARFFRLAFRDIAGGTDERTGLMVVLPPGSATGDTAHAERVIEPGPNWARLLLQGAWGSFPTDWTLRQRVRAHVNMFIANGTPIPRLDGGVRALMAHAALRLTCNHAGYAPLWREQVGDAWREPTPPFTWPVLDGDDARWAVRAAIDAVVADAYGLTRDQYEHVLSTFSHKSYPAAPARCLAAFDELKAIGLDAFTKKHDPYWDIPLNESLPKPVIDLPVPTAADPVPGQADSVRDSSSRRLPQATLFTGDAGPLFSPAGDAMLGNGPWKEE